MIFVVGINCLKSAVDVLLLHSTEKHVLSIKPLSYTDFKSFMTIVELGINIPP